VSESTRPKARVGLIGTGWWATYTHLPALAARTDVSLVALADCVPERLQRTAEHFRIRRTYPDARSLLEHEQVDGVVVATSHAAHFEAAEVALEYGCHVLLEKPMTLDTRDARKLVELADQRGREIVMSYPWNYTPHVLRARELLHGKHLGRVELVSSTFSSAAYVTFRRELAVYGTLLDAPVVRPLADANSDPRRGGGQAHIQLTHSAALSRWITGLPAERVSAFMNHLDVDVDVVDALSARLNGGALAVLASTGHLNPGDDGQHTLDVYCSEGYLRLDLIAGTLRVNLPDGTLEQPAPLPAEERYPRFAPSNNLVDIILSGAENQAPGSLGCATVELIDAAYRSAATDGTPVSLR
jgi:predicted dehydrogenase